MKYKYALHVGIFICMHPEILWKQIMTSWDLKIGNFAFVHM